jgi:flagellar basal-body rod protein FlgG
MMRSLWTGASGMKAQQFNVDTISNNIANVNTTGYKRETTEFKSLLYQTMSRASEDNKGNVKPTNLQVGLGVRYVATSRDYTIGNLDPTGQSLDLALEGEGFLTIDRDGEQLYTRDLNLKLGVYEGEYVLSTTEGYPVMSTSGERITIPKEVSVDDIAITPEGTFEYTDKSGVTHQLDQQLAIVQFRNRQGLEAVGSNFYASTVASGDPIAETDGTMPTKTRIKQGYKESSNVQIADEMVKLIVAQRAYELNSKSIQTSDSMLELANNLKR